MHKAGNWVSSKISSGISKVKSGIEKIKSAYSSISSFVKGAVSSAIDSIGGKLSNIYSKGKTYVKTFAIKRKYSYYKGGYNYTTKSKTTFPTIKQSATNFSIANAGTIALTAADCAVDISDGRYVGAAINVAGAVAGYYGGAILANGIVVVVGMMGVALGPGAVVAVGVVTGLAVGYAIDHYGGKLKDWYYGG